jgi:TRAP transporter TAXI family solute receptor
MITRRHLKLVGATALICATAAWPADAQDIKLPSTLTLTAYDTGSSGFNIAVAVGKMLKDKHNSEVRVLPAGNDVARLGPLKAGRAQASFMGVGSYFAQEGVFEFAVKEWGPQPVQFILASLDCNNISIGIAADTGAKEIKDLKGKRVAFVVGSPALNQNMLAMLAFGGLTRSDVKIVEFASYGASWKGMLNNEIDAAVASNISGQAKETETSPRGLFYPSMPASDTAGWERVRKIGPYFQPHKSSCGTSASKDKPLETSSYPYPILMHYGSLAADTIYNLTKAMVSNYDLYKDGAPGAAGLNPQTQNFQWVLPVNPAAVKAFKEAGVWKDADEVHNNRLLARQKVLIEAWAAHEKGSPPAEADAFRQSWMAARKAALEKAGMEAIFE